MRDRIDYNGYAIMLSERTDNMDGKRKVGTIIPIYFINPDESLTFVADPGIITRKIAKKLKDETTPQLKQRLFQMIKDYIDELIAEKNKVIPVDPKEATDEEFDSIMNELQS